jgi:hypothetical protein
MDNYFYFTIVVDGEEVIDGKITRSPLEAQMLAELKQMWSDPGSTVEIKEITKEQWELENSDD